MEKRYRDLIIEIGLASRNNTIMANHTGTYGCNTAGTAVRLF